MIGGVEGGEERRGERIRRDVIFVSWFCDEEGKNGDRWRSESDLPASLAVGDGAFKRRAVLAFRGCAALRERTRELHQIVDGLCV